MSLYGAVDQLSYGNCTQWVRTSRGWVLQQLGESSANLQDDRWLNVRPGLCQNNREASQGRNIRVTGMKGQRRLSVCLSEFIEYFDLQGAAVDIRRKAYLYHLMMKIMENHILKVSGTSHQQLFKVLETMFIEALQSEYMISEMKNLLVQSLVTLRDRRQEMIGSKRVWNRHLQTVSNMCTKMEQFSYKQREDDGMLTLTDLPKECLIDIMMRFSDHRDLLHLGQTCWYFNDLIQDPMIWERLTQYHFSEKQMITFISDTGDLGEYSAWQNLYRNCYRKYGFKGTHMFTDKPVICSACKTLHWMMLGHNCWSNEESNQQVFLEPVTSDELISILQL